MVLWDDRVRNDALGENRSLPLVRSFTRSLVRGKMRLYEQTLCVVSITFIPPCVALNPRSFPSGLCLLVVRVMIYFKPAFAYFKPGFAVPQCQRKGSNHEIQRLASDAMEGGTGVSSHAAFERGHGHAARRLPLRARGPPPLLFSCLPSSCPCSSP